MPGHDLERRPSGQICQGLPPRPEGLHANELAQPEAVTGFSHARHAAKYKGDKNEQGWDNNHGRECRERIVSAKKLAFLNPYSACVTYFGAYFQDVIGLGSC